MPGSGDLPQSVLCMTPVTRYGRLINSAVGESSDTKGRGKEGERLSGWSGLRVGYLFKIPIRNQANKKKHQSDLLRLPLVSIFFIQNYVKSISPALNCIRKGPALQIAPVLGLGSTPYLKKVREENPCHQVFKEFSSFFF